MSNRGVAARGSAARRGRSILLAGTILAGLTPVTASAQDGTPLGTITVEADSGGAGAAVTEGKDTYTSNVVTVGGKDARTLREIPQSVSVVTRQRIEDQNFTQLDEAMRRTTGMVVLNNDAGRSSIFSRGYELTDVLVDGLPAPVSSLLGTQPDLAIFDRIEVLKGPNGLFSGAASGNNSGPGATVNLARKRPTKTFKAKAEAGYGSWNNYRGEIDVGGKVTEDGRVRARIVGAFQDRDTWIDLNHNQVWVGYGTVEADLTPNTTLSVAAWRQERDIVPFNGLPAFKQGANPAYLLGKEYRSTFIGAGWNRFDNYSNEAIAELEHRFDTGGHVKAAVRYVDRYIDYKYAFARTSGTVGVDPATGALGLTYTAANVWEKAVSSDAHVTKPFELFGQTHNVTLGVDFRNSDLTNHQPSAFAIPGTYNLYAFDPYAVPEPNAAYMARTNNDATQYGAYGQLRIKPMEPFTVLLGGRVSNYHGVDTNLAAGTITNDIEENGKFTPYAAFIVDLSRYVSAYVSYTDMFVPQTERGTNGATLAPRTGDQYEGGLKASFFDGRLNASASLFLIHDIGRAFAISGCAGPNCSRPADAEVKGFEIEVGGSPLAGWELFFGYTNSSTAFTSVGTGDLRTYWPQHNYNLWSKYTFQDGALRNLHVAGGVKKLSGFYQGSGANRLEEDGYTVVDLQVGYKFNEYVESTFTVTNLFDEVYYARVASPAVFNFFGEPRAYMVKTTAKW